MSETLSQRRIVDNALHKVRSNTNAWEIVFPRPIHGAIGFALERPLYDYLTNPDDEKVPRGAAALCVFHKNYRPPAAHRRFWQIENERFNAYADQERNTFLRRAEDIVGGKSRILYARAMEFGCMMLLDQLGYEVSALKGSGRRQSGIDLIGVKTDPEEEAEDQVVAVECKTTAQGFERRAVRVFFNAVLSSLRRSRDEETVRAVHPLIDQHDGVFDYLVATNREFRSPEFRNSEGYFVLRGIEVE
jgi:hypothetical protein